MEHNVAGFFIVRIILLQQSTEGAADGESAAPACDQKNIDYKIISFFDKVFHGNFFPFAHGIKHLSLP